MSDDPVTRRTLLKAGAVAGAAAFASSASARTIHGEIPWSPGQADRPNPVADGPYRFFTSEEAAFVEAAVDRLIPADKNGPGARALGCATFIDRQLAGEYGVGQRWYMQGPWPKGTPTQGYQTRLSPAQLYRAAIKAVDLDSRRRFAGKAFAELGAEQQDGFLAELEQSKMALDGVDAGLFFEHLLQNTIEGFFADPLYGGNKQMQAWKMIGFPGARYNYRDWVSRHGERYSEPPVALYGRPDWRAERS